MNKKTVSVEKSTFKRLLAKAGLKNITDLKMRAQVVTAADGTEFTVEREEGDPQVGDAASPDGTYILDDGTEVVVEDGVITSIIPADEETESKAVEEMDEEELIEKVEELTEEVETLETENEELREELEAYKGKGARVLSANDKVILAKVNKAGGLDWLNTVLSSSSSFTSQNRRFVETGAARKNTKESSTQKAIREQKEKAEAKRAARRK